MLSPTGYEGPNCEIDIDECAMQPCLNAGECFQRSDPTHWELGWELDHADAAGYICQCKPGFAGQQTQKDTILLLLFSVLFSFYNLGFLFLNIF